jgi:hypothetical protein
MSTHRIASRRTAQKVVALAPASDADEQGSLAYITSRLHLVEAALVGISEAGLEAPHIEPVIGLIQEIQRDVDQVRASIRPRTAADG